MRLSALAPSEHPRSSSLDVHLELDLASALYDSEPQGTAAVAEHAAERTGNAGEGVWPRAADTSASDGYAFGGS